jgi:hypothetical protein
VPAAQRRSVLQMLRRAGPASACDYKSIGTWATSRSMDVCKSATGCVSQPAAFCHLMKRTDAPGFAARAIHDATAVCPTTMRLQPSLEAVADASGWRQQVEMRRHRQWLGHGCRRACKAHPQSIAASPTIPVAKPGLPLLSSRRLGTCWPSLGSAPWRAPLAGASVA